MLSRGEATNSESEPKHRPQHELSSTKGTGSTNPREYNITPIKRGPTITRNTIFETIFNVLFRRVNLDYTTKKNFHYLSVIEKLNEESNLRFRVSAFPGFTRRLKFLVVN